MPIASSKCFCDPLRAAGKSQWWGFVTSDVLGRSPSFCGRVAVAHVQGSPKGGGALARAQVTNTRLFAGAPQFKRRGKWLTREIVNGVKCLEKR